MSDLWDWSEIDMLSLHSGEVIMGPLDVMREPDGTIYGFRFRGGDRRVIHKAAVKISIPVQRNPEK